MAMPPLTTSKLIINMANGQNIQTQSNDSGDLAGLINAGTPKVYVCTDRITGNTHSIVVSAITDFYEVPV